MCRMRFESETNCYNDVPVNRKGQITERDTGDRAGVGVVGKMLVHLDLAPFRKTLRSTVSQNLTTVVLFLHKLAGIIFQVDLGPNKGKFVGESGVVLVHEKLQHATPF